jgi:alpha-amylase
MFDIAINGMALVGGDTFDFKTIDYSHFIPFNKSDYFHPYCPIDFSNDTSNDVVCPF